MATLLGPESFYGRHEPSWMGHHHGPYFVEGPYNVGFHDVHPFSQDGLYAFSPYAPPYPEPLARIRRATSAMAAFGHYTDAPFLEPLGRPGPLRSSSAIPTFAFHDVPHGPTRSSSSSSMAALRESRPKQQQQQQHKVAPEIELRVPMVNSTCEQKLKEALRKLPGVTEVVTDKRSSMVTVGGKVDPQLVLKQAQKVKRKAEFWTKDIYSRAFIDFIQSKTGRAEPEPEVTSSYHQHALSEEGDRHHHAYEESGNLSSYEEYAGYSEHDELEMEHPSSSHTHFESQEYYYNQFNCGSRSDMDMPCGMPASSSFGHVEHSYGTVDDRPRYESSPYYEHAQTSFEERVPYYERYGDSSLYRPSQGYYGPSGLPNPGYVKPVISDY